MGFVEMRHPSGHIQYGMYVCMRKRQGRAGGAAALLYSRVEDCIVIYIHMYVMTVAMVGTNPPWQQCMTIDNGPALLPLLLLFDKILTLPLVAVTSALLL